MCVCVRAVPRLMPWLQPGSTWCTSFAACLFQPSPLCAFASVCVCFSYSAASGLSPARSFNSNCRLFVWVCPYKHTISHVLCSQDYSWLWPQFSSGLLPGSLGGPCRQTSVLPESRKIRTTAHRLATTGKLAASTRLTPQQALNVSWRALMCVF